MELSRSLSRALAASLMGAGMRFAVPSHAITIVGKWDPSFGFPFPDLGWRGEARFFLPNACLALSGWVPNSDSCSDLGMKIISSEVEFYKVSDPTNPAFQEILDFDLPLSAVDSMRIESGLVTGVNGTFLYSRPSTLPLAGAPFASFVLFFEGDLALMSLIYESPNGTLTGVSDRNAVVHFSVVSEPNSVPLVLAALLAIGWPARRPSSSSPQPVRTAGAH